MCFFTSKPRVFLKNLFFSEQKNIFAGDGMGCFLSFFVFPLKWRPHEKEFRVIFFCILPRIFRLKIKKSLSNIHELMWRSWSPRVSEPCLESRRPKGRDGWIKKKQKRFKTRFYYLKRVRHIPAEGWDFFVPFGKPPVFYFPSILTQFSSPPQTQVSCFVNCFKNTTGFLKQHKTVSFASALGNREHSVGFESDWKVCKW